MAPLHEWGFTLLQHARLLLKRVRTVREMSMPGVPLRKTLLVPPEVHLPGVDRPGAESETLC